MTGHMTDLGAESGGLFFGWIPVYQSGFHLERCATQGTHAPASGE